MIVGVVILAGVVVIATGRGGEMAYERADFAPVNLGPVSATDVVLLRPPTALWGYNMQITDDALESIAASIRERDVRIVALEQRLADLRVGRMPGDRPRSAIDPPAVAEPPTIDDAPDASDPSAAAGPSDVIEPPAAVEPRNVIESPTVFDWPAAAEPAAAEPPADGEPPGAAADDEAAQPGREDEADD